MKKAEFWNIYPKFLTEKNKSELSTMIVCL